MCFLVIVWSDDTWLKEHAGETLNTQDLAGDEEGNTKHEGDTQSVSAQALVDQSGGGCPYLLHNTGERGGLTKHYHWAFLLLKSIRILIGSVTLREGHQKPSIFALLIKS